MTENTKKNIYTGSEMCGKGAILLIKIAIILLTFGVGGMFTLDRVESREKKNRNNTNNNNNNNHGKH